MELNLSLIAIAFSLLNAVFFFMRGKKARRSINEITKQSSRLQLQQDSLQLETKTLKLNYDQLAKTLAENTKNVSLSYQSRIDSTEAEKLRSEITSIKREIMANTNTLAMLSSSVELIKDKQMPFGESMISPEVTKEIYPEKPFGFNEITVTASLFSIFEDPLNDLPAQDVSTEIVKISSEATPQETQEPFFRINQQYQDAIDRQDRTALRQIQIKELNITIESEELLLRGSNLNATKLEAVAGGGSFLLMSSEGRYWLFPTAQTLIGFGANQPKKGIFTYEQEMITKPLVKKPAEVREEGDHWVVTDSGIISVPG